MQRWTQGIADSLHMRVYEARTTVNLSSLLGRLYIKQRSVRVLLHENEAVA